MTEGNQNTDTTQSSEDAIEQSFLQNQALEYFKRRREVIVIFLISFLFVFLTWFEVRLFSISQNLPFIHSIFFFGLVNFNIVLLLFLLFLIFRNIVKVFVERRGRVFGSNLKGKLVAAFVAFSFVPTVLMFFTSVFYINSSFDKWFSAKMSGVLKSSLEVTRAYYINSKKKNYHFAHSIAEQVQNIPYNQVPKKLKHLQEVYSLDAVEYYPTLFGKRELVISNDESIAVVPPVSLDFLQKGIKDQVEASVIHQFGEGNLVRVIVPVAEGKESGAIVVSSFVPLSLTSKIDDISAAYDDFKDINPLEYPLKSIYLIILFLMTFVILLAATWFGFHLAKQLSIPLVQLGRATRRIAQGDYTQISFKSGSDEITQLIDSFNVMSSDLDRSQREIKEYTQYIEVVLKNVSAGVISVDRLGRVTTMNERAGSLLKLNPDHYVGRPVSELLNLEYFSTFSDLIKTMQENKIESLNKEFQINVQGEAIPLSLTLSILKDLNGHEIGKIIVFDDMTHIVNAQRAQAWTEVARRIAHEIKNPLTPIKLSAERLQRKFGSQIQDEAFKDCTTMIIKQTDDLRNLVNEFSQFARLPQAKPIVGSLNHVVDESLKLFKQSHPHINLSFNKDERLPEFKFDPDQIKRVVVNLVDNAIAAVPKEGGVIDLVTHYDSDLKIVRLTVTDNGSGIPKANLARIFEPYFSTKESGTGLGLAIVKRIIEDHSGFIRAVLNNPKGTKMIIELPVRDFESRHQDEEKYN